MADLRDELWAHFLSLRNVQPGDECSRCSGLGVRGYASTATWRGGIGGQAITSDVCDRCWGSGSASRPWPSHRRLPAPSPASAPEAGNGYFKPARVVTGALHAGVACVCGASLGNHEREPARYRCPAPPPEPASAPAPQTDPLAALVRRFVFEHPEQPGTLLWGMHTLEDGTELGMDPDDFALEADRLLSASPAPQTEGARCRWCDSYEAARYDSPVYVCQRCGRLFSPTTLLDPASTAPGAPEPGLADIDARAAEKAHAAGERLRAELDEAMGLREPSPSRSEEARCQRTEPFDASNRCELAADHPGWHRAGQAGWAPDGFDAPAPSPAEEPKPAPSRESPILCPKCGAQNWDSHAAEVHARWCEPLYPTRSPAEESGRCAVCGLERCPTDPTICVHGHRMPRLFRVEPYTGPQPTTEAKAAALEVILKAASPLDGTITCDYRLPRRVLADTLRALSAASRGDEGTGET